MEFNVNDYQITEKTERNPLALKETGLKFLAFSKKANASVVALDNILKTGDREAKLSISLRIKNAYDKSIDVNSCEEFDKINADEIIENFIALNYLVCGRPKHFNMSKEEYLDKLKELKENIDVLANYEEPTNKPAEILGEELYNNALTLSKDFAEKRQEKYWEEYCEIEPL